MMNDASPNHKIGFTKVRNRPACTSQAQAASDRHALHAGNAQKPPHAYGVRPQSAPSAATWPVCISRICISDKQPDVAFSSTQKRNRLREPTIIRGKAFIGALVLTTVSAVSACAAETPYAAAANDYAYNSYLGSRL